MSEFLLTDRYILKICLKYTECLEQNIHVKYATPALL